MEIEILLLGDQIVHNLYKTGAFHGVEWMPFPYPNTSGF